MATRQIPWARIVAEGVAIVVSILLAFGIQAWWEGRQDREEEAARLEAVRAELVEALEGYGRHMTYLDRQDERAAAILRERESYSGSPSKLDSLLFSLGPFNEFVPPLAAYEDAISAGAVSIIRSGEVRQALAEYGAAVRRDQQEQDRVRDQFATQVAPLWSEYTNTRNMLAAGGLLPEGYPEVTIAARYEELFRDPQFANQVAGRSIMMMRVRARHRAVMDKIEELLDLLE